MENRINRPRVFLSHSKKDGEFIKHLADDLRPCHIEPWLDTEEIRDGKPWLKMIFEDGIPTCDLVLVYLTENSLTSKMVEKEIDAALIEQMADNGIAFLPYVSTVELRGRLRSDLRALQIREWNARNYGEILPKVVAEIWRSFMERTVRTATLEERNKRLELELEMRTLRDEIEGSVFEQSEEKDFQYIHSQLARTVEVSFSVFREGDGPREARYVRSETFAVPILFFLVLQLDAGYSKFAKREGFDDLRRNLQSHYPNSPGRDGLEYEPDMQGRFFIEAELRRYGLTRAVLNDPSPGAAIMVHYPTYRDEFTDKMYRFRYWIGYCNHPIGSVEPLPPDSGET